MAQALHAFPAALLAFALAACGPAPKPADGVPETAVTVTDTACQPNALRVRAGRNRLVITNASMRPLEWEILDGVMVVDERENIAPGFVQTLTATLKPGEYVMTCGLLTNPRGTLVVEVDPDAAKAAPMPLAFVSAQAEYKVYVHARSADMQREVEAFADALRAGDVARARELYAPSRQAWQTLAPVASLLSGPYDRLEGNASLYAGGASDPAFVGWHRIAALLFDGEGATAAQLAPLADALQADARAFAEGINAAKIGPERILSGAAATAARIAGHAPDRREWQDIAANAAGLRRVATLFSKALAEHAPERDAEITRELDALDAALAAKPADPGAVQAAAKRLSAAFTAAAEHLGL